MHALSSVLGLPCWQVRWDSQVGLDMNFGPPRIEVREPRKIHARSRRVKKLFASRRVMLRGSHWLILYPGRWRLELADGLVVRDSSSVKQLDMAVARLGGEKLQGVAIDSRTGSTTFYFDLGGRIVVRGGKATGSAEQDEFWSLHARSRYVSVYSGGGYATGSISSAETEIMPLDAQEPVIVARNARLRREILKKFLRRAV